MCIKWRQRVDRAGFTAVELLIVISIIVILVAFTTAAVMRFQRTGPALATTANMDKIKGAFDAQWTAVRDKAQKDSIPAPLLTSLGGGSAASPVTRKNYVEAKLVQAFPTSFSEVLVSPPAGAGGAWPAYTQYLNSLGATAANAATVAPPEEQMAVCLLMVLERGPSNTGLTRETLGTSAALPLPRAQNIFGCVDAWGRPLLWARQTRDNPTNTNTNNPLQLKPVILSMGPDGRAGVDSSLNVVSLPDATDNLYTKRPEWDGIFGR